MDVTEMVITHENAITHTLPIGFVPFQWRVGLKQASGMHRTKSGGFSSDEGEMPVEGDGIHPGKKTRRKSEKEMRIFANGIKMKGGTNKRPFLRHITERGYSGSLSKPLSFSRACYSPERRLRVWCRPPAISAVFLAADGLWAVVR